MDRIGSVIVLLFSIVVSQAQTVSVEWHPNNRRMALVKDSIKISDYVFSEMSAFSEGKAYAARGDLYAYIDEDGIDLTPYEFVVANDFNNGFAIVGDSQALGMINNSFEKVLAYKYLRILHPEDGYVRVQNLDGKWGMYNLTGVAVLPEVYDLPPRIWNDSMILVNEQDQFGIVDHEGEILFNTSYQYITADGFAYKNGIRLRLFFVDGKE